MIFSDFLKLTSWEFSDTFFIFDQFSDFVRLKFNFLTFLDLENLKLADIFILNPEELSCGQMTSEKLTSEPSSCDVFTAGPIKISSSGEPEGQNDRPEGIDY